MEDAVVLPPDLKSSPIAEKCKSWSWGNSSVVRTYAAESNVTAEAQKGQCLIMRSTYMHSSYNTSGAHAYKLV